jgi:hypothetical protein
MRESRRRERGREFVCRQLKHVEGMPAVCTLIESAPSRVSVVHGAKAIEITWFNHRQSGPMALFQFHSLGAINLVLLLEIPQVEHGEDLEADRRPR